MRDRKMLNCTSGDWASLPPDLLSVLVSIVGQHDQGDIASMLQTCRGWQCSIKSFMNDISPRHIQIMPQHIRDALSVRWHVQKLNMASTRHKYGSTILLPGPQGLDSSIQNLQQFTYSLTQLTLSGHQLSPALLQHLPSIVPSLTNLDLTRCAIVSLPDLTGCLEKLKHLQHLSLPGLSVGYTYSARPCRHPHTQLAAAAYHNACKHLHNQHPGNPAGISEVPTTKSELAAFYRVVSELPKLTHLDISHMPYLVEKVSSNMLTALHTGVPRHGLYNKTVGLAIQSTKLTSLRTSYSPLLYQDYLTIGGMTNLTELAVSWRNLPTEQTTPAATLWLQELTTLTALQSLQIDFHYRGTVSVYDRFQLPVLPNLTQLVLIGCNTPAAVLSAVQYTGLRHLGLRHTGAAAFLPHAIVQMAASMPHLNCLDLSYSKGRAFNEQPADIIMRGLSLVRPNLEELIMHDMKFFGSGFTQGLEPITLSPCLPNVQTLTIFVQHMPLRKYAMLGHLPSLRKLTLTGVTPKHLKGGSRSGEMQALSMLTQLTELRLIDRPYTPIHTFEGQPVQLLAPEVAAPVNEDLVAMVAGSLAEGPEYERALLILKDQLARLKLFELETSLNGVSPPWAGWALTAIRHMAITMSNDGPYTMPKPQAHEWEAAYLVALMKWHVERRLNNKPAAPLCDLLHWASLLPQQVVRANDAAGTDTKRPVMSRQNIEPLLNQPSSYDGSVGLDETSSDVTGQSSHVSQQQTANVLASPNMQRMTGDTLDQADNNVIDSNSDDGGSGGIEGQHDDMEEEENLLEEFHDAEHGEDEQQAEEDPFAAEVLQILMAPTDDARQPGESLAHQEPYLSFVCQLPQLKVLAIESIQSEGAFFSQLRQPMTALVQLSLKGKFKFTSAGLKSFSQLHFPCLQSFVLEQCTWQPDAALENLSRNAKESRLLDKQQPNSNGPSGSNSRSREASQQVQPTTAATNPTELQPVSSPKHNKPTGVTSSAITSTRSPGKGGASTSQAVKSNASTSSQAQAASSSRATTTTIQHGPTQPQAAPWIGDLIASIPKVMPGLQHLQLGACQGLVPSSLVCLTQELKCLRYLSLSGVPFWVINEELLKASLVPAKRLLYCRIAANAIDKAGGCTFVQQDGRLVAL